MMEVVWTGARTGPTCGAIFAPVERRRQPTKARGLTGLIVGVLAEAGRALTARECSAALGGLISPTQCAELLCRCVYRGTHGIVRVGADRPPRFELAPRHSPSARGGHT